MLAIVSGLSTAYAQLMHMPGYGVLRGHRGANGRRHVFIQPMKVPIIGRVFVHLFDVLECDVDHISLLSVPIADRWEL